MKSFQCPIGVEVDAYQSSHPWMIPSGMERFQCSQATHRKPLHYGGDERADHRIISAGMLPFVLLELEQRRNRDELKAAIRFYSTFGAKPQPPYVEPYPFPAELFRRVYDEFEGHLPIVVTALRDGQTHYVGEPHAQVWTDVEGMGELVGWVESTMLPYDWVSSTVATRGMVRKVSMLKVFKKCYPSLSEEELLQKIAYKFHDFGRRGAPASQISGIAHLINWLGTDTCDAAYAAQYYLNGGVPFGACSIPAAAHRTVTPWKTELQSIENAIKQFGHGFLAFVADSYGFRQGIRKLATSWKVMAVPGGFLVGRPDSGDVVECVLEGLEVFAEAFGTTLQEIGLRVINNAGIIQGDGVSDNILFEKLYPAVIAKGFCPSNLAIGMGEYNHRAVRSDMELAYKTSLVGVSNGEEIVAYRPVMKDSNSSFKRSFPGLVAINHRPMDTRNRVVPIDIHRLKSGDTGELVVLYDGRKYGGSKYKPLPETRELFSGTRSRAWKTWNELPPVAGTDNIHPEIREAQRAYLAMMAEAA